MFTGIIEELGIFNYLKSSEKLVTTSVSCTEILKGLKIGDSIAVNGVCLTVSFFDSSSFIADVMPETLNKTNLGKLKPGSCVNLEKALLVSDRLGGHFVSGHIDGVAYICEKKSDRNAIIITFSTSKELLRYMVQKGSVAIDGVSLTIAFIDRIFFGVSLIPLTAKLTTLGYKNIGDEVNIECDIIGKYIEKFLTEKPYASESKITQGFLKEHGFA
ncbi:MAG TPA: riboflavin synthase [Lentisphaeria bacterium]|nr:MAG: riboflavin synthase subunit alpha [Lentisphaerae bacterium GWF2_38_69]HBM15147.1 riboflavin synthase [Lentisphaeria bacterium]